MSSKSPDSCVSGNVDIFRKKYQKILSFKKVTANLICGLIENIRLRHSENYAISVGTAQEYFLILTDIFSDCVSISQSEFFC